MKWLKLALLILAGVLLANQLDNPVLSHLTDKNWLVGYIQKNGALGHVVIFTFSVVFLGRHLTTPARAFSSEIGYIEGSRKK